MADSSEIKAVKMQHEVEIQERDSQIQQLQKELKLIQVESSKVSEEKLNMASQTKSNETEIDKLKKKLATIQQDKLNLDAELIKANAKIEIVTELNAKLTERNETLSTELSKAQEKCKKFEDGKLDSDQKKVIRERDEAEKELQKIYGRLGAVGVDLVLECKKNADLVKENKQLSKSLKTANKDLSKERNKAAELSCKIDSFKAQINEDVFRHDKLVGDLIKKAVEKFVGNHHEESIELRCKAIGIEEVNSNRKNCLSSSWSAVSSSWYRLNRYGKALQAIEKAIKLDPSNAVSFYKRASYYFKMGNNAKAVSDARKSLKMDPNHQNSKDAQGLIANLV